MSSSNATIAKNTMILYVKMLVSLVISLYTSRVILEILGQDDFGIYNVVGGVVVLFSFLTNAMTASTQRFLNYNFGLKEENQVSQIFSTSVLAHITILFVVLVLAETIGLWFVTNHLNIPAGRHHAAMWVYQMSVLATLINIIIIPYRASIIATERMSIFAYISILEVVLKLLIVLVLPYSSIDRLILYSILFSGISLLSFSLYKGICHRKIAFTHFHFVWNKKRYYELMSFSGWYLFGGIAVVGAKQGTNILINIFFNVAVNAAVGIANQVRNAIYGFVSSFQTAFNPQIVKLYAANEHDKLLALIYRSTKFSYYLLFLLSLPVIMYCEEILSLWLVDVPQYTVIFTQLVIITSFTEALSAPLWTAIGATGKVKKYQFFVSLIILLDIPLLYVALKLGCKPDVAFWINLWISIVAYIYRLLYIRRYIQYNILDYAKIVILPCIGVTISSFLFLEFLESFFYTYLKIAICIVVSSVSVFFIGLDSSEKKFIRQLVKQKINR